MLASTLAATLALALHMPQPGSLRLRPPVAAAFAPRLCAAAGFVTPDAPPLIETECAFDHVPLSIALQTGDFLEADQITRDSLIKLAGEQAVGRGYVYFTEVAKLPEKDLATMERLWLAYSGGKFGYSVQAKELKTKKIGGNLEKLFVRIGWMNDEGKLLRWLPEKKNNEFIYELDKAPNGHLPLTNTLRGQQLISNLLRHKCWDRDEFK